jgi:hypothetical protein
MKNPIIITIFLVLSSMLTQAQINTKQQARADSVIKIIPVGEGRHSSFLYTIGGQLATSDEVKLRLLAYAPSAPDVSKATTEMTWARVSGGIFLASSLAATFEFIHENKLDETSSGFVNGQLTTTYQHHDFTGAYVLTGIATGFLIAGIVHLVNASHHVSKAVGIYNERFQ